MDKFKIILNTYATDLGFKLVDEYKFHPTRKWRFDYAIPELKLAFEYEGAIWIKGRHLRGIGYSKDCIKYNQAQNLGWKVYRFTSEDLNNKNIGTTCDFISDVLRVCL